MSQWKPALTNKTDQTWLGTPLFLFAADSDPSLVHFYLILDLSPAHMTLFEPLWTLFASSVTTQEHHIFVSLHAYLTLNHIVSGLQAGFKAAYSIGKVRLVHHGRGASWGSLWKQKLKKWMNERTDKRTNKTNTNVGEEQIFRAKSNISLDWDWSKQVTPLMITSDDSPQVMFSSF